MAASGNTALNASDVQALVDSVNAERASAEAAIQAHENGGVVAPTLGDYALAGVSGVNGTNLALVNAAVAASGNDLLDVASMQVLVDGVNALLAVQSHANSGSAPASLAD